MSSPPPPTPHRWLGLLERFLGLGDPDSHPGGLIYGLIVLGSVLAAESVHSSGGLRDITAALTVLFVYWLAHTYADLMGRRYQHATPLSWREVRQVAGREWAIMRGATIPVAAMLIAVVAGLSSWRVDEVGMITDVGMLTLFAVVGGLRANLSRPALFLQVVLALSFGVFIALVRAVLA